MFGYICEIVYSVYSISNGASPEVSAVHLLGVFVAAVFALLASVVVSSDDPDILVALLQYAGVVVFGLLLLSCFIPFQIVLIPMAKLLGVFGLAGTTSGLVLVHLVYGVGFTTLFFRNYYAAFPTEIIKAAQIDGAGFFRIFWR